MTTRLNGEQREALKRTRTALRTAMAAAVLGLVVGVVLILTGEVLSGLCLLVPGAFGIYAAERALAGLRTETRRDWHAPSDSGWDLTGGGWDA